MADVTARGNIPLLVGGTMLYFKALLEGLADLPQACPETRADIDAQAIAEGWPAMHAELARFDPDTAKRLHPGDSQRIQRALVALHRDHMLCAFLSLGLLPSQRTVLHERIAERFDAMLKAGLEEEVRMLRSKYRLNLNLPSMRCVGYRQVWEVQDGLAPRPEMRDRGIYATRQLAKRQITWLTNTLRPERFDCLAENLESQILGRVASALGG